MTRPFVLSVLIVALALPVSAQTQSTPPASAPQPTAAQPEYPIIRVGVLSYLQYAAETENRDGANSFDVTRAYLNINAQVASRVRFRFTPDIRRVTDGSLSGSLTLRVKYAFGQLDTLGKQEAGPASVFIKRRGWISKRASIVTACRGRCSRNGRG
jgi:hypothetical protein